MDPRVRVQCSAALLLLFKLRFIEIFHFIWKVVNFQPISSRIFNFNTILIPQLTKCFHPYISEIALEGSTVEPCILEQID